MKPKSGRMIPESWLLAAAAIFYFAVYCVYYPPIYAYRDEASYLAMTYVYRLGKIFIEGSGIPVESAVWMGSRLVNTYDPGVSWLLIPFSLAGWQYTFLAIPILHLAGFWFFCRFLALFNLPRFFGALYLFFPIFLFYSRTIMADVPSAVCILAGSYYYFDPRKSKIPAALFWGGSLFFRITNGVILMPFVAGAFIKTIISRRRQEWLGFWLALAGMGLLIMLWNALNYGSPFKVSRMIMFQQYQLFHIANFLPNFKVYAGSLMLAYPLMLLAPLFARRTRLAEAVCAMLLTVIYYSLYFFRDRFENPLAGYLLGVRYLLPVLPFILLNYAECLWHVMEKIPERMRRISSAALVLALAAASVPVQALHRQALESQRIMKEAVYAATEDGAVIIYDTGSGELLQDAWGRRVYISLIDWRRGIGAIKTAPAVYLILRKVVYAGGPPVEADPEFVKDMLRHFNYEQLPPAGEITIYRLRLRQDAPL